MSIAERKEREKEQRRKDITDAAEKLFFSRGYDSVTMDDIAKAVELNKATIYLYFKDKESLFFAVVLHGVRLLHSMVRESVKDGMSGAEKLRQIGETYYAFAEQYPDYKRAYHYFYSGRFNLTSTARVEDSLGNFMTGTGPKFWEVVDLANAVNNEAAKEIIRLNGEIFSLTCDVIKSGISEGTFRKDLDPVEAAVMFTLLMESIPNMRPDLRKVLGEHGIGGLVFSQDIGNYINDMFARPAPEKKKS
jgi:TetR/AcrR family transcriptional regulator